LINIRSTSMISIKPMIFNGNKSTAYYASIVSFDIESIMIS